MRFSSKFTQLGGEELALGPGSTGLVGGSVCWDRARKWGLGLASGTGGKWGQGEKEQQNQDGSHQRLCAPATGCAPKFKVEET